MIRDIFFGTLGALIGFIIAGMIGYAFDPKHRYYDFWTWFILMMVVIFASGFIWGASAIFGDNACAMLS